MILKRNYTSSNFFALYVCEVKQAEIQLFVINLNDLKAVQKVIFLKAAVFTDASIRINASGKQNTEGIAGKENGVLCQQYHLHCFF